MKKSRLNILLLGVITTMIMIGCYEDKGNYDYTTESVILSINNTANWSRSFTMEEQISVGLELTIHKEGYDYKDLRYEWKFNSQVISTDSILFAESWQTFDFQLGRNTLEYIVIDSKYGMRYNAAIYINITTLYGDGWFILCDDGGESALHYLKLKDANTPGDIDKNVYKKVNGISLGRGPIKLHKTSYQLGGNIGVQFEFEVMQESGITSMYANLLEKNGEITEEFLGGSAPAGFVGVDGFHRDNGSVIVSRDGDVYVRNTLLYNKHPVPHSGRYNPTPIYIEKGLKVDKMNNFDSFMGTSWGHIPYCILHDTNNNRMVMFVGYSNGFEPEISNFGNIYVMNMYDGDKLQPGDKAPSDATLTLPDLSDLGDYSVVNMGMRVPQYDILTMPEPSGESKNFMVLKDKANTYYILRYDSFATLFIRDVELMDMYRFPTEGGFDDNSKFTVYVAGNEYMLYTGGGSNNNKLYLYRLDTKVTKCIYEAKTTITSIRTGVVHSGMLQDWFDEYSIYQDKLIVGTAGGEVVLLNMDNNSLSEERATVIKSFSGLGKVVDIDLIVMPSQSTGAFAY